MKGTPEPSAMKNLTGGGGCGCGCLGGVGAIFGLMAIAGIYIELYEGGLDVTAWYGGLAAIVLGVGLAIVGVIMFIGSLFID
jgi:hypothetical protein